MGITVEDMHQGTRYMVGLLEANGLRLQNGEVQRQVGDQWENVPGGPTVIYATWCEITFCQEVPSAAQAARRDALFLVHEPVAGWDDRPSQGSEMHALISRGLDGDLPSPDSIPG